MFVFGVVERVGAVRQHVAALVGQPATAGGAGLVAVQVFVEPVANRFLCSCVVPFHVLPNHVEPVGGAGEGHVHQVHVFQKRAGHFFLILLIQAVGQVFEFCTDADGGVVEPHFFARAELVGEKLRSHRGQIEPQIAHRSSGPISKWNNDHRVFQSLRFVNRLDTHGIGVGGFAHRHFFLGIGPIIQEIG